MLDAGVSSVPVPAVALAAPALPASDAAEGGCELPRRCVTFRVEGETYALDVLRVREVLRSADIVPVPGAPDSVLGIINLRGSIVPVIDARSRLGLPAAASDAPCRVLVMESDRQAVGLRVDSVAEVMKLRAEEFESTPVVGQGDKAPFIRGVARSDDGFIVLVDVDKLLPSRVGAGAAA
ncbi:chemotaxis protein CheW [Thioalkalivibrio sp. XN279]|nr:chemotaxis protein CheW [Thioalkalivibrio sp. XN279]